MTDRIEEIRWVLVDLILDLCGSSQLYREHSNEDGFDPHNDMRSLSIIRVCQTSSVIGLSRLWELLDGYRKEVHECPEPLRGKLIALKKEIEERKVYKFRSKYIGHVFDKDQPGKAPIKMNDGYPLLEKVVGSGWDEFYDWVYPGIDTDYSSSVLGIVQEFRDYCNSIVGPGNRP